MKNDDSWQVAIQNSITDLSELCELLNINLVDDYQQNKFTLRVPREFIAKMQPGNNQDPLLLQILPQAQEQIVAPGFNQDPLQENNSNPIPGLLHKYNNRALLLVAHSCAINCRYCFRREFSYKDNIIAPQALEYIAEHPEITEVILSGGDPLIAPDKHLAKLITKITAINHVQILRIHTRLPIVIPQRITNELINILVNTRLKVVIVMHCNHPQEICADIKYYCKKLQNNNITLLNQSVLLKNINDNVKALTTLSYKLFDCGVMPYYLHMLDPVAGSCHFEVDAQTAGKLYQELLANLPGYLVPKLVREIPGAKFKVPVSLLPYLPQ